MITNYPPVSQQSPALRLVQSSLKVPRWKVHARIRTVDGQTLRGEVYFRPSITRIWDALNNEDEEFIAMTGVTNEKGHPGHSTYLINFNQIVYLSFSSDLVQAKSESVDPVMSIRYRKVPAWVRTVDGVNYFGKLSVREALPRLKDELNGRGGHFIPLEEVLNEDGQPLPGIFFLNKQHIVFTAVANEEDPAASLN